MVGYSSIAPDAWVETQGGWQFRYNIAQANRVLEDGTEVDEWMYDYVNIPMRDRGMLIDALITSRYSLAAQVGKCSCDRSGDEWSEWDEFRQLCYSIADAAM